jgi:hypothetical protein
MKILHFLTLKVLIINVVRKCKRNNKNIAVIFRFLFFGTEC